MTRLQAGAAALGVALDAAQCDRLLAYLELLDKWNRAYNLTAVRDRGAMLGYHLLDSLSALQSLHGSRVLDIGSGAGLPGIPLAIVCPGRRFVLLDSNGKKTRFCVQAVGELGLGNVAVERSRIEDYRPAQPFDTVISRAFAELNAFVVATGRLVAPGGRLLAMKGRLPDREIAALPDGFRVAHVERLAVPEVSAERSLVQIEPI